MTNPAQGPSFCDYFRSFYYAVENTYHPLVDLSDQALCARGDVLVDQDIPEPVRSVLTEKVQTVLSQPRTLDREKTRTHCATLIDHGLTPTAHDEIPCLCTIRTKEGLQLLHVSLPSNSFPMTSGRGDYPRYTTEDRLLALELHRHIELVAGNKFEVSVPKDSLIPLDKHAQETEASKRYCILADREFPCLSRDETIAKIKQMTSQEQTTLATNLCFLIQKVGLAGLNLKQFRLCSDGKISIETAPCGVLAAKQSAVPRGESIEKCARIGLSVLVKDVREAFGTAPDEGGVFRAHIENVHAEAMRPKLSKWKIVLSVLSLGLLPLIYAIISLVQVRAIQSRCQRLNQLRDSYDKSKDSLNSAEQAAKIQQRLDLVKSIFSMTEEVPFSHGQTILDKVWIPHI